MNSRFDLIGLTDIVKKLDISSKKDILLGSSSPRRIELLKDIKEVFKIIKPIVDEDKILKKSFDENKELGFLEDSFLSCANIAYAKAKNIYEDNKGPIIISADTIVITEDRILGKPKDKEDAYNTLVSLLGTFHYVTTGVCIFIEDDNYDLFYSVSGVKFVEKNDFILNYLKNYVDSGEPMDKAGSYGAQQIGKTVIEGIYGDFYNIIGFPIVEIRRRLYENFS